VDGDCLPAEALAKAGGLFARRSLRKGRRGIQLFKRDYQSLCHAGKSDGMAERQVRFRKNLSGKAGTYWQSDMFLLQARNHNTGLAGL